LERAHNQQLDPKVRLKRAMQVYRQDEAARLSTLPTRRGTPEYPSNAAFKTRRGLDRSDNMVASSLPEVMCGRCGNGQVQSLPGSCCESFFVTLRSQSQIDPLDSWIVTSSLRDFRKKA
jgi:hypothetical protein